MSDGASPTPPASPTSPTSPTSGGTGSGSKEAVQAKIKCITSPDAAPIEEVHTLVPGGSPVAINIPGTGTIKLSANFLSDGDDGSEAGDSLAPSVQGACECDNRADREAAAVSNTLKQIVPLRKMLSRIRKKVEILSTNISGSQPPRVECGSWYGGNKTNTPPQQLPISCGPPVGGQSCGRTKPPPTVIEEPPTNFQNGQSAQKTGDQVCQEGPSGYPHSGDPKGYDRPYSDQYEPRAVYHQSSYDHPHSDHHREAYNQPQSAQPYCPNSEQYGGNFNQNMGANFGRPCSEQYRGSYDHPHSVHHDRSYGHPHSDHHREDFQQPQSAQPYFPNSERRIGGYDPYKHHPQPPADPVAPSDYHREDFKQPQSAQPYYPNSECRSGGYNHYEQHPQPPAYPVAPSEDPRPAPPERLCQGATPVPDGIFSTPYLPRGPYMAPPTDPLSCKPPPEINNPRCTPQVIEKPKCPPYATPVNMDSCSTTPCAPCPFRQADNDISRMYDNRYNMKYGTGVDVNVRNDAPPCCVPQLMGRCEPCATTGPRKDSCAPCEYRKEPTC